MELEAEDGCVIFIPRGCKKELGRGPGIAVQDRTVSRHQILVELQEPRLKVESVDKFSFHDKLNVSVLGPNPVCVVHSRKNIIDSKGKGSVQGMMLLRKDETDLLSVGDKISLSITHPVFFTLKGGQRMKDATSGIIGRSGSTAGEHIREEPFENVDIRNQVTDDDLLTSWKSRKKGKESGTTDDKMMKCPSDDRASNIIEGKRNLANEEEDGIAEAVARRQKRAYERHQQKQQKQLAELCENSREGVGAPTLVKDNIYDGQEAEHKFIDTEGIDPVKEFGFIVEGSEFEQYGKHLRLRGKWDLSPPGNYSDEDEEQEGMKVQHLTSSKRKKGKKHQYDEDWLGEDQVEQVEITTLKTSKPSIKLSLRSHGPSSSLPKEEPTEARRDRIHKAHTEESEEEEEDEEDEEDETLAGFIVSDDEEEEEIFDEEDEWRDDDENDEEEYNNSNCKVRQKNPNRQDRDKRPLCKYGRDCYRKNKEHLEQYRH